jgi:hypothetical protein
MNSISYAVRHKSIITMSNCSLPQRCIYCNADAQVNGKRFSLTLMHLPGWVIGLLAINALIFSPLYFFARKRINFEYSLCSRHKMRRLRFIILSSLAFSLCFGLIVLAIYWDYVVSSYEITSYACLSSSIIGLYFAYKARGPRYLYDISHQFHISGFSPSFLASLKERAE